MGFWPIEDFSRKIVEKMLGLLRFVELFTDLFLVNDVLEVVHAFVGVHSVRHRLRRSEWVLTEHRVGLDNVREKGMRVCREG